MDINSLLPFFDKYGIKGVLGLIVIYFVYSIIKLSWFDTFIKEMIDKYKNKKSKSVVNNDITDSDILNHDILIFGYILKFPQYNFQRNIELKFLENILQYI